jgi:hypothetical protein
VDRRGSWFSRAGFTRFVVVTNLLVFAVGIALARSPRALLGLPGPVLYALGMSDALAVVRELRLETLVTS